MAILPPFWQSQVDQGLLAFKQTTLNNLSVDYRAQVWGQVIPLSQGSRVIPGAPLWATDTQVSITYTEDVSNQHFSGLDATYRALVPTATYTKSFAVAFGRNLAPESEHAQPVLKRLWINNVLVYDGTAFVNNVLYPSIDLTFYPGSSTQGPDATIAADRGDLTPSYKNMIYVVIRNFVMWQHTGEGVLQLISANVNHAPAVPPTNIYAVPDVRAELVDGSVINSVREVFTDTDPSHTPSTSIVMPNWDSRHLFQVIDQGAGALWILDYDMDGEVQTSATHITGNVDGSPYGSLTGLQDRMTCWDKRNDYIWTTAGGLTNGAPVVTINKQTGVITSQVGSGSLGTTFVPIDVDGNNPFTTGKDVFLARHALDGDVGFYRIGGSTKPILGFGDDSSYLYSAVTHGAYALDAQFPREGCYDFSVEPGWATPGVKFFKFLNMLDLPIAAQIADQDAIGIYCASSKAWAVYFKAYGSRSKILAVKLIRTFSAPVSAFWQDPDFGLTFVTDDGSNSTLTRIVPSLRGTGDVSWGGSSAARPDGFAGLVPDFAGASVPYANLSIPHYTNVGTSQGVRTQVKQADTTRGTVGATLAGAEWSIINLRTGVVSQYNFGISAFDRTIWDGVKSGFVGEAAGHMSFVPLAESLNYTPMELDHVLRWLSFAYKFDAGHQTIDAALLDPVLGIALLRDYASDKLFGDMGKLYNFTSFESEGKIKFVKLARNPVKAKATLTFHVNVNDGDSFTVSTNTYVFRTAPALPFEVKIGALLLNSRDNLIAAINLTGTPGTEYAAGTTQSAYVTAAGTAVDVVTVTAIHGGSAGNSITLNESSGGRLAVSSGNLIGGADAANADFSFTVDNLMPVAEGGAGTNDVLITTLNEPSGGIASVQVAYYDFDKLYQPNTTIFTNDAQTALDNSAGQMQLDVPIVFNEAEVYQRAAKIGLQQATASITQEFRTGLKGLTMEPVDVASITIPPYNYLVKLDEVTYNGDWSVSVSGLNYSQRDDVPIPPMVVIHDDPTAKTTGDAFPVIFDIPLPSPGIADVAGDFTLFEGVRSYGQPGFTLCGLSVTVSGTATLLTTFAEPIPYGLALDKLPDTTAPFTTDTVTTLRVACKTMDSTAFASVSDADFLAGKNTIVIGAPGRWEIVYFRDVTVLAGTLVQLSTITRGRRGTEGNVGTHGVGDQVYLVASAGAGFKQGAQFAESRPIADVAATNMYSAAGTPAQKPPNTLNVTYVGLSLYPFAPVNFDVTFGSSSSVDLTWARRDRHATNDWVTDPVQMSEAAEKYDIEIMSGSSVVRTIVDHTSRTYNYSAANQTTDGFTAPVADLKFRVYQKGALGRGFKGEATCHVH